MRVTEASCELCVFGGSGGLKWVNEAYTLLQQRIDARIEINLTKIMSLFQGKRCRQFEFGQNQHKEIV